MNDAVTPPDFGSAWREIEPAVRRSLAGAPPNVVEDVLQETGIKLMRVWGTIEHGRPALPLAITIARNSLRDELRRVTRHSHAELSEEHRVADDLDAQVFARLELSRVEAELARLTPGQRAALLMEIGGGRRSPDTPRIKMLRARARRRLRDLVAHAGGVVTSLGARIRGAAGLHRGAAVASDVGMLVQALLLAVVAAGGAAPAILERRDAEPPTRGFAAASDSEHAARSRSDGMRTPLGGSGGGPTEGPGASAATRPPAGAGEPPEGRPLPGIPIPRSKGEASDSGYFGAEGFDFAGEGGTSPAGQDTGYRYEAEWESPECVQRLAEGGAPGRCTAPESPRSHVQAEAGGQRARVRTDS